MEMQISYLWAKAQKKNVKLCHASTSAGRSLLIYFYFLLSRALRNDMYHVNIRSRMKNFAHVIVNLLYINFND